MMGKSGIQNIAHSGRNGANVLSGLNVLKGVGEGLHPKSATNIFCKRGRGVTPTSANKNSAKNQVFWYTSTIFSPTIFLTEEQQ